MLEPAATRIPLRWACALAVSSLLSACGSAESDCENLAEKLCDRLDECVDLQESPESCTDTLVDTLQCSRAVEVSDDYDDCISDVESVSCDELVPGGQLDLPNACMGVILIE